MGDDSIFGGAGRAQDLLSGGIGADRLVDTTGSAFISDGPGRDLIRAGDGRDDIVLTGGSDRAFGGKGPDSIEVGADHTADLIKCGPGRDRATFKERREAHDRYVGCERIELAVPDPGPFGH
jgi:Ca2+-binding RTX toxin-like protein